MNGGSLSGPNFLDTTDSNISEDVTLGLGEGILTVDERP